MLCMGNRSGGDFRFVFPHTVLENHSLDDLSQAGNAVEFPPMSLGASDQHENHRQDAVPRDAAAGLVGAQPHRGEGGLDRISRSNMDPVLGRKIVEGQQGHPILFQAFRRLRILGTIDRQELIESVLGVLPSGGHPDLLQRRLGLGLLALGQLVQNIGCFMNPTALGLGRAEDLGKRLPEAQGTITGREMGIDRQPAGLQIQQHFTPGSFAFSIAISERQ